ncbi:hypothetical protein PCASD_21669, partial [Puccinia coronata f. sp. avenae]
MATLATDPHQFASNDEQLSQPQSELSHLIRDPTYILQRLKEEREKQQKQEEEQHAKKQPRVALPWEAIIPAELITKRMINNPPEEEEEEEEEENDNDNDNDDVDNNNNDEHNEKRREYVRLPESPKQVTRAHENMLKKEDKFLGCLTAPTIDMAELRKLAWTGIPPRLRALVWMILLGYLPTPESRRLEVLARKRREYRDALRLAFGPSHSSSSSSSSPPSSHSFSAPASNSNNPNLDHSIWHQIKIDVARTNPGVPLWQLDTTQRSLERILYVWAIRHPASGYVQGINDLVTPFFQVFLTAYIDHHHHSQNHEGTHKTEHFDLGSLPSEALEAIEADSFWSLSKLLEGIQDNYIFAQPGIQRQVARLKELCERVDAPLHKHLQEEKVEFIQFAFRWINCLLMRELSTQKIIRMWDTYLAEGTAAFSEFHLYVCLAFLVRYSEQLRAMDFQAIIIFLQALPTEHLTEKDL